MYMYLYLVLVFAIIPCAICFIYASDIILCIIHVFIFLIIGGTINVLLLYIIYHTVTTVQTISLSHREQCSEKQVPFYSINTGNNTGIRYDGARYYCLS